MSPAARTASVVSAGALVWAVLAVFHLLMPPSYRDLGSWGLVVIESDDWGLEGWFPDEVAAAALESLVEDLPPRLAPYRTSSLEQASDIRRVAAFLAAHVDNDGLPAVLQANSIVAGPTLSAAALGEISLGWPIHPSGEGHAGYRRPGLREAVDDAIDAGLWWPELHGLTHFDLPAYARARTTGDEIARRALSQQTFAYRGWRHDSELNAADPQQALVLARAAAWRFHQRFGRLPRSVIAPDYRWGFEDEQAWASIGIEVVQAKREQIESRLHPRSWWGRLRKRIGRSLDQRRGRFVYLDRPARLEPYGDPDPACQQGAYEAAEEVRKSWRRGEPGVLSVHRVQLVNQREEVAIVGLQQLGLCLDLLSEEHELRFVVDAELGQLLRRGWSVLDRGPWRIVRNYRRSSVEIEEPPGHPLGIFAPGTHIGPRPEDPPATDG